MSLLPLYMCSESLTFNVTQWVSFKTIRMLPAVLDYLEIDTQEDRAFYWKTQNWTPSCVSFIPKNSIRARCYQTKPYTLFKTTVGRMPTAATGWWFDVKLFFTPKHIRKQHFLACQEPVFKFHNVSNPFVVAKLAKINIEKSWDPDTFRKKTEMSEECLKVRSSVKDCRPTNSVFGDEDDFHTREVERKSLIVRQLRSEECDKSFQFPER